MDTIGKMLFSAIQWCPYSVTLTNILKILSIFVSDFGRIMPVRDRTCIKKILHVHRIRECTFKISLAPARFRSRATSEKSLAFYFARERSRAIASDRERFRMFDFRSFAQQKSSLALAHMSEVKIPKNLRSLSLARLVRSNSLIFT